MAFFQRQPMPFIARIWHQDRVARSIFLASLMLLPRRAASAFGNPFFDFAEQVLQILTRSGREEVVAAPQQVNNVGPMF
jgi:hypothetical protein